MGTKYIVNNVSGQTINGETFQRPYKVYTALLRQSGGDNPESTTSGTLDIGRTYEITSYQEGDDFTNVGAPSNNTGIKFVATGGTPSVWTNSSELSWNYGAPVVVVLENTIGYITWGYNGDGNYGGYLISGFPLDKTYYSVNGRFSDDGGASAYDAFLFSETDDFFVLTTWSNGGVQSNSLISNNQPLSIEIRVYN